MVAIHRWKAQKSTTGRPHCSLTNSIVALVAVLGVFGLSGVALGQLDSGVGAARVFVDILDVSASVDGELTASVLAAGGNGFSIEGLESRDFVVSVDGQVLPLPRVVPGEGSPGSRIVIAVDVSGSMKGDKLESAKDAVRRFVQTKGATDEVLLLSFDSDVRVVSDFTRSAYDLLAAVDDLSIVAESAKETALYDAVFKVSDLLSAVPGGRKAAVLLTDGEDTGSAVHLDDAVRSLQMTPVRMYVIGYTLESLGKKSEKATADLQRLAMVSNGHYYISPKGQDLSLLYEEIARTLRTSYRIEGQLQSTWLDGLVHEVAITVTTMPAVSGSARRRVQFPLTLDVVEPVDPPRFGDQMILLLGIVVLAIAMLISVLVGLLLLRKSRTA